MGSFASVIAKHFEEEYRFEEHYRNRPQVKPLDSIQNNNRLVAHQSILMNLNTTSPISRKSFPECTYSPNTRKSSITSSASRHSSSRISKYYEMSSDEQTPDTLLKSTLRKNSKPDLKKNSSTADFLVGNNKEDISSSSSTFFQKQNSLPCITPHGNKVSPIQSSLSKSYSMRESYPRGDLKPKLCIPDIMVEHIATPDESRFMIPLHVKKPQNHNLLSVPRKT